MTSPSDIRLIAFDFFGTLARNSVDDWRRSFVRIIEEQHLATGADMLAAAAERHVVEPNELWDAWRRHEVNFRKTRTNMEDPPQSPPFRTYWAAWRDAFVEAFAELKLDADADAAATVCVDDHRWREQFADASPGLAGLADYRLAILSNADDRFLLGCIAHNGWAFDTVLSSEQAMAYKPDPRIFATFCEITGVEPAHVLYVGDSPYDDAHGAKLAGMQTALVRRDGEGPPTGVVHPPGQTPPPEEVVLLEPDFQVDSITALAQALSR